MRKALPDSLTERFILDDINHDDLVGPGGGGGIPEAPFDGMTYGRGGQAWYRVLPISGGQLTGFLITPNGTQSAPGLMIGSNDSGFYRGGSIVYLACSQSPVMAWMPGMTFSWSTLDMGDHPIRGVSDATIPSEALNLRTADARYARNTDPGSPAGPWADFVFDPGWTSTMRYRLLNGGVCLQFEGMQSAALAANSRARMGVLPAGFRPARLQRVVALVSMGLGFGYGMIEFTQAGDINVWGSIGDGTQQVVFAASHIIAMD